MTAVLTTEIPFCWQGTCHGLTPDISLTASLTREALTNTRTKPAQTITPRHTAFKGHGTKGENQILPSKCSTSGKLRSPKPYPSPRKHNTELHVWSHAYILLGA